MEYVIITLLVAIILILCLMSIYINKIYNNFTFSNNGENIKPSEDKNEVDDDGKKVKGLDKINTFKPEDFDKNI